MGLKDCARGRVGIIFELGGATDVDDVAIRRIQFHRVVPGFQWVVRAPVCFVGRPMMQTGAVGMAREHDGLRQAHKGIPNGFWKSQQCKWVTDGRVGVQNVMFRQLQRQGRQIVFVFVTEIGTGQLGVATRLFAEKMQVFQLMFRNGDADVVVAFDHGNVGACPKKIDDRIVGLSVNNEITQADQAVDALAFQVIDNPAKRVPIAVDIGQNADAHALAP